jgi:hypothetical protein
MLVSYSKSFIKSFTRPGVAEGANEAMMLDLDSTWFLLREGELFNVAEQIFDALITWDKIGQTGGQGRLSSSSGNWTTAPRLACI